MANKGAGAKKKNAPAATAGASATATVAAFALEGSDGRTWTEKDLVGATTVIYFYPKDNTSGCTTQACAFRDAHAGLTRKKVRVIGVSPDSVKSHLGFIAKQRLPFVLLADVDLALAKAFGVWVEKSLYGRKYMGVERSTFLVGPDLRVRRVWRKVKVAGHVDEVVAAASAG
ncbi:MAG TPA: peroxiredoxin [Planctomycetota bacterium]|nr:peroxiredoxin [Planctomycetota bacterium]